MVYCLEKEESYCAKALFNDWQETLIWSALQGCMGEVYVNDKLNPCSGQIVIGDFCFFAGEPENELVMNIPENFKSSIIIMAGQNEEWDRLILECLSKGLYPSWDAQNKASLELSKKLGYHFDKEYTVYEVET